MLRETKQDKQKELKLIKAFANLTSLNYQQNMTHTKYRIDGWLYDNDKTVKAWLECKWYGENKKAYLAMNPPKFNELVMLSKTTGIKSYFIIREHGRWGYIQIHSGDKITAKYSVVIAGGTPKGRIANPDDIEPLIRFDYSQVRWQKSH
jgi:hypothetical protein